MVTGRSEAGAVSNLFELVEDACIVRWGEARPTWQVLEVVAVQDDCCLGYMCTGECDPDCEGFFERDADSPIDGSVVDPSMNGFLAADCPIVPMQRRSVLPNPPYDQ